MFILAWVLSAAFAVVHALYVDRYLDRVSATEFARPLSATPLARVPQAIALDGQTWVRQAIHLAETGAWRLRSAEFENAPDGRDVYWNSGWALWLEGLGRVRRSFTGEPLETAIENAATWSNLPLFLAVMTCAALWVRRRWGSLAGAWMAIGLTGAREFYEGFYPAYCDHHGLISASALSVILGATMGGFGRFGGQKSGCPLLPATRESVRRGMVLSAVGGALGLWFSAASIVIIIAATGVGGVLIAMLGRERHGGVLDSAAWSLWGRVGGAGSLLFYLAENAPDRFGLRLEANHPVYAVAWWCAGEAIAGWLRRERGVRCACGGWKWPVWFAGLLPGPVLVATLGSAVFAPLDPFLKRVHESIHEFQSIPEVIGRDGLAPYNDWIIGLGAWLVIMSAWRALRRKTQDAWVVLATAVPVVPTMLLGIVQNRWLHLASAALVVSLVAAVVSLCTGSRSTRGWIWGAILTCAAVPGPWKLIEERVRVERVRDVQLGETLQLVYRDIAAALREDGAGDDAVLLSDPNASVAVGYYGRFKTIGTLYWENRDGLRAAAEMLCTPDDADAAARMHARGVTHVVLLSVYDFVPEYLRALHGGDRSDAVIGSFAHRVLHESRVPVWLRPIDYRMPGPIAKLGIKVAVFAVDVAAPPSLAHERIALHQLTRGEWRLAEASLMAALSSDPSRPDPWLLLGEVMLATGRATQAFTFVQAGLERAPEGERDRLRDAAIQVFERRGATTEASQLRVKSKLSR